MFKIAISLVQVSLFMKLWNGPLTSLLVDGRVKAVGGDGLENWQLERLIDDAHEAPMFNALALTTQRGRFAVVSLNVFASVSRKGVSFTHHRLV